MRCAVLPALFVTALAGRLRYSASKSNEDYSLELENHNNVQYSAPISLGGQELPVIYDTGSFEILVLSTLCQDCAAGLHVYDNRQSHSFTNGGGITAEHLFGSGPVKSEKAYETVRFGGRMSPFAVDHMPFWQIVSHNIPVWNEQAHFSGIVGLGHSSRIPEGFGAMGPGANDETLLSKMHINSFGICLQRGDMTPPGWLTMGPNVANLPSTTGAFHTLRVVGQVHWGVQMTEVSVPGISGANPCSPSCGAIVDSGTSLIAVPPSALPLVNALSRMIKKDCSNINSLPVLRLQLDGTTVELPPMAYVMQVQTQVHKNTSIWRALFEGPSYEVEKECTAAFMQIDKQSDYGPMWILGMPFLRYYYTIFDRQAKEIKIARSTPDCQVASAAQTAPNWAGQSLVNSSHFAKVGVGSSTFSPADYKPMSVDLNEARAPDWAFGGSDKHLKM